MLLTQFAEKVEVIKEQASDVMYGDSYIKFLCKEYYECKEDFDDERENLMRWLLGEPCEFYHERLGREIYLKIENDVEEIYYFLCYVQFTVMGKNISDMGYKYLDARIKRQIEEYGSLEYLPDDYDDFDEDDYYDEDYYDDDDGFFDEENFPDYPYTAEEKRKYHLNDHIDYDEEDDDEYLDEDSDYCEEKYEFADFD